MLTIINYKMSTHLRIIVHGTKLKRHTNSKRKEDIKLYYLFEAGKLLLLSYRKRIHYFQ